MHYGHVLAYVLGWPGGMYILVGVLVGAIFGALPGLSAPIAIVLVLPLTLNMPPDLAIVMLAAMYSGAGFGGSISAILLNIPGQASAAATMLDGYPMAERGEGGQAIGIASSAALLGGLASVLVLAVLAPVLLRVALLFQSPELFWVGIIAICTIAILAREALLKGVIMALLGLLLTFIGPDPLSGSLRYTFHIGLLSGGINLLAIIVAFFAVSEALYLATRRTEAERRAKIEGLRSVLQGVARCFRFPMTILQSAGAGAIVGLLPGVGSPTAAFLSYALAKGRSKQPDSFGKGNPEGVLASETAIEAVVGSSLVPTLTLGIPGSEVAGLLLAALILHGLSPGPELLRAQPTFLITVILGVLAAQFGVFVTGPLLALAFVRVKQLPPAVIVPFVLVMSTIGVYSARNSGPDVLISLMLGVLAFILRYIHYPAIPLVIAFLLGPIIEQNFTRSLLLENSYRIFISTPTAAALAAITVGIIVWQVVRRRGRQPSAAATAAEVPPASE